jgi:hypothetical protein
MFRLLSQITQVLGKMVEKKNAEWGFKQTQQF